MDLPLSLYVHFPWCVKKCPYCDFNSHEVSGELPEADYVTALLNDLDRDIERFKVVQRTKLTSIFFGGGTPSLISPEQIHRFLLAVAERFDLTDDTEITMEANPGTTDEANFIGYREAGVNRISLGVQSFGERQLTHLGRIHTADQASLAFISAQEAGFTNINLDLMHGLPEQTVAGALFDLDRAIALGPEHISWYQLTIEPNTVFFSKPPQLPEDETLWKIFAEGTARLTDSGYSRYEVSAFSKPGKQARHNLNYWQFGNYLGIGAGAHGKFSTYDKSLNLVRTSKTRLPNDYLKSQKSKEEIVPVQELTLEFLMNALRLVNGFTLNTYESRTGLPNTSLERFIGVASHKGLIERTKDRIKPTELGLQYLNDLLLIAADQSGNGFE